MSATLENFMYHMRKDPNGLFIIRNEEEDRIVTTIVNNVNDDCFQMTTHLLMGVELLREVLTKWIDDYILSISEEVIFKIDKMYCYDVKSNYIEIDKIGE